jgi:hypothetical protein
VRGAGCSAQQRGGNATRSQVASDVEPASGGASRSTSPCHEPLAPCGQRLFSKDAVAFVEHASSRTKMPPRLPTSAAPGPAATAVCYRGEERRLPCRPCGADDHQLARDAVRLPERVRADELPARARSARRSRLSASTTGTSPEMPKPQSDDWPRPLRAIAEASAAQSSRSATRSAPASRS